MPTPRLWAAIVIAVAILPIPVRGQTNGSVHPTPPPVATAVPLEGVIAVDGWLDEAAWERATPASGLLQSQPEEGAPASLTTEVRFLFDDRALYIGARMMQPGGVVSPLARRDQLLDASGDNGSFNSLTTDKLIVRLDPYHNHLDDAWFEVNPAGARGEQFNGDASWDPIWEAATRVDSLGWTAEMRIPFSQLRFSPDSVQTWGLQIWRYVDRSNEQNMWAFRRRSEAGGPAFYGHLEGLRIPAQPRQLEVLPYVVAGSRFERAAGGDPYNRDHEMKFGVGADLKYLLTTNLTLDATFNPDFGQVEVDPASLNLSAYETFYDEKRPFFVAGRSAFGFGGMRCMFCNNTSGLGAFYSRRIGRAPQLQGVVDATSAYVDAPDNTSILAAAKVTGRTDGGYTIGVLDAVTGQETAHYLPTAGADEAAQVVEPLTNYFVSRVKKEFRGGATTFGGILTSTARHLDDPLLREHLRGHAEAGGVDWYHTWAGRTYNWMGSVLVSNVGGSAEAMARTQESSARYFHRPDRTATGDGLFDARYDPTATSLRGYGLFTRVGKDAGTFRWEAMSNIRSPGFEVNDLAFLSRADYLWFNGNVAGSWTIPTRWYRNAFASFGGATEHNYDGDRTRANLQTFTGVELPNYWNVRLMGIHDVPAYDDRLTRGGPVVRRAGYQVGSVQLSTDARSPAVFDVQVLGVRGIGADTRSLTIRPGVALKPASNVFIQLSPGYSSDEGDAQYVTAVDDPTAAAFYGTRYVFGFIRTRTISLNTRLNWTFTPDLTLQLFAQPFIASGDYSSFREFAAPRTIDKVVYGEDVGTIAYDDAAREYTVDPDGAGPAAAFSFGDPDFTTSALRGTAVLRWEYRPGSTLFFVWTQQRSGYEPIGTFDLAGARAAIFDERPMNVFQIKATYWFGR
ncbi:MAG TPA: DUF5916 domain-containing protein [Longimicrobiales bacterium]|nr:DUF5916 domain-containing protein [Longimicrobiales bacterium]